MKDLAIIIPAYKAVYLEKTLQSIAQQSNQDFKLYIGDDCSPHDLAAIIEPFKSRIDLKYVRFPDNVGAKNLVLQWKRCVELVQEEKWIWLFSDDDLMDPECVDSFYRTIAKKRDRFEVYRFDTLTINDQDEVTFDTIAGPEEESSESLTYHLLLGKRGNTMPDHIFTKAVYERCGGFVYTRYAQAADWATSILFSQEKGISIIPGAKVSWRNDGGNISSGVSAFKSETMWGHIDFVRWMVHHIQYLKIHSAKYNYHQMLAALVENLSNVLIYHYKGFPARFSLHLLKVYHQDLELSYYEAVKQLLLVQRHFVPFLAKMFELYRKYDKSILSVR